MLPPAVIISIVTFLFTKTVLMFMSLGKQNHEIKRCWPNCSFPPIFLLIVLSGDTCADFLIRYKWGVPGNNIKSNCSNALGLLPKVDLLSVVRVSCLSTEVDRGASNVYASNQNIWPNIMIVVVWLTWITKQKLISLYWSRVIYLNNIHWLIFTRWPTLTCGRRGWRWMWR